MGYDVTNLSGITENSLEHFEEQDLDDVQSIHEASLEELMEVKYMREDRAEQILDSADRFMEKADYEEETTEDNEDLFYDPSQDEWLEEEPENFVCECGAPFPSKAVYLAHEDICNQT